MTRFKSGNRLLACIILHVAQFGNGNIPVLPDLNQSLVAMLSIAPTAVAVTPETFRAQIASLATDIAGRSLDAELDLYLNRTHGAASETYRELKRSCEIGVAEGWLCNREGGNIRYGRIFKPADDLHGFSVDVVDMKDVVGPHHVHPNGEIDLIMPIEDNPQFNGRGAGWLVCPPGSAHHPTVSGGRALVLYLLPQGAIEFTKN